MNGKRWLGLIACTLVMIVIAEPSPAWAQEKKPRLLFLTHSAGFKHGSLATAERIVIELGERTGLFEAVTLQGYRQSKDEIDLSMISADYLAQFDAVMFYTTGNLPLDDSQKKALFDFVNDGKAYIGVHSATDTFYAWPTYGRMSGAYFSGHGRNDKVLILTVEDTHHPATRMLGDTWPIADEFYHYGMEPNDPKRPIAFSRERLHVLLSVDTERSDLSGQAGMEKGGEYPLAWCQNFGQGRSFYTALGHRDDVWTNLTFQAHLLGGIKWAFGMEEGDATPSAKIKK